MDILAGGMFRRMWDWARNSHSQCADIEIGLEDPGDEEAAIESVDGSLQIC